MDKEAQGEGKSNTGRCAETGTNTRLHDWCVRIDGDKVEVLEQMERILVELMVGLSAAATEGSLKILEIDPGD